MVKSFDKKGREEDRPFFLSSWAGNQVNEVDRIGRGNIYVPSLCISIFGSIVPSVLNKYLNEKMNKMGGDDGLMDRIQLLIHPESLPFKEDVDRIPDTEKLKYVAKVFKEICENELETSASSAIREMIRQVCEQYGYDL